MSCFSATVTTANVAEPNPTKHVNYNLGMVLGVADFQQEHAYLSGRDQWMARDLIGYGTVRGLKIDNETDTDKGPRIAVEPGVAVSPRGQMICVPTAQCAYLKDWIEQHSSELSSSPLSDVARLYIVLCYRDCPTDNVPIAGEPCRSEDQLVAASRVTDDFSLELRVERPNQREEDAVRDFVDWLKQIGVSDSVVSSTPMDQFLDAIRAAARQWFTSPPESPLSSPPSDYMVGSPPAFIHIHTADVCEYMRAAFRLWVTELRPKWIARWHGCAAAHFETDDKAEEDCVMLAELTVPIIAASPGNWTVDGSRTVRVDESRRPFMIHLRMLQEWLLCGCSCGDNLSSPPGAQLNRTNVPIENVAGPANINLSSNQRILVCDAAAGVITLNLPPANNNVGCVFIVKRINVGANAVRIAASGTDLIDGAASAALAAPQRFIEIVANVRGGSGVWHIIGGS
jgi:hypothetical protein